MAAIDPVLARGVKLLLSNDPDAADQLRAMLDDALRNKYGVGMKLPAKIAIEEPGRKSSDSQSPKLHSPSPPVAVSDESSGSASADLEDSFCMNFTELSCVVCGQFNVGVRNQLMECNSCQQLYHQDCHNPPVKELASSNWDCAECLKKKQVFFHPKVSSPASGGKPAAFASLGGSAGGSSSSSSSPSSSSHKSSSKSGSSSSHKSSSKSSSHSSSHSSHSSSKRHSSSSSSHKSSSHHKSSSSSRHSK
ncbi:hypothetical protein ONE63_006882 [Megalurothrips usitatus]|uniref:PHD-type domain-containing protein n=1 Tax=Megalurothrips usitatus TaxID=439358 RepID=A0AAV7XXU1_9NEOP|nr:hypothetical protein ONE63_006882 [Megalurothrips usitatus]